MKTSELLRRAALLTFECVKAGKEEFLPASEELLQKQPAAGKWSAIQCLEHLNACGRHYIPAMNRAVAEARSRADRPDENHRLSFFGSLAVSFIKTPDNQSVPKVKLPAFKFINPLSFPEKTDYKEVLDTFIDQQNEYAKILQDAALVNLRKVRVPLLVSGMSFPLGDALLFAIEHNKRHLEQARRALKAAKQDI